ncbi:hypothetical protein [Agriterribacter sp.]|uniref:hypothetical protein n=1 Tax=Agriterribacter sp. TaxID=2821509 RepID=UPI002C93783B|nr:hypothetical protein [Agriterribacter sp.]HTN07051.1 hypothetical protein [Agriterribacter sp.]
MIKKIAPDKWRHFLVGVAMGALLQAISWWLWPTNIFLSSIMALAMVITISYGFELFSKITGKGRYDFMDAVASVTGGVLGMAAVLLPQAGLVHL